MTNVPTAASVSQLDSGELILFVLILAFALSVAIQIIKFLAPAFKALRETVVAVLGILTKLFDIASGKKKESENLKAEKLNAELSVAQSLNNKLQKQLFKVKAELRESKARIHDLAAKELESSTGHSYKELCDSIESFRVKNCKRNKNPDLIAKEYALFRSHMLKAARRNQRFAISCLDSLADDLGIKIDK